jgi:hypothetical protein
MQRRVGIDKGSTRGEKGERGQNKRKKSRNQDKPHGPAGIDEHLVIKGVHQLCQYGEGGLDSLPIRLRRLPAAEIRESLIYG